MSKSAVSLFRSSMMHEFFIKPLIKLGWQGQVEVVGMAAGDLFGQDTKQRQIGERVDWEKRDFAGFRIGDINAALIVEQIAQKKELING